MKMIYCLAIVVGLAGAFGLAGCGKKPAGDQQQQGAAADLTKLREAFASAGPEVQTLLMQVQAGYRYGEYGPALAALGKLAATPNLTDDQKALVSKVSEDMKQMAGKAAAPAAK